MPLEFEQGFSRERFTAGLVRDDTNRALQN